MFEYTLLDSLYGVILSRTFPRRVCYATILYTGGGRGIGLAGVCCIVTGPHKNVVAPCIVLARGGGGGGGGRLHVWQTAIVKVLVILFSRWRARSVMMHAWNLLCIVFAIRKAYFDLLWWARGYPNM